MNAREFCQKKGREEGECWSNDMEALIKAFEEYAQLRYEEGYNEGFANGTEHGFDSGVEQAMRQGL